MNIPDSTQAQARAPLAMQPLPHQERVAVKLMKNPAPGGGLIAAHATGTGKTFTSIVAAHATGKPLVAVVPAALRENYRKELAAAGFTGPAEVLSYHEALRKQHDPAFRERLKDSVVVYDEAHRMGREDASMSALPKALPSYKNLLLTGTLLRNHPSELVPLLQAVRADGGKLNAKTFTDKYIKKKIVKPGLFGRIQGAQAGEIEVPHNLDDLQELVKDVVDIHRHEAAHMPTVSEEYIDVPMSPKQVAAYDAVMRGNPGFAYKLRHGIPPGKDFGKYRAFLMGLRQISNTPSEFSTTATASDATKVIRAAEEVDKHHRVHPEYRGYTYSSFLKSGLLPLQKELERRGISTAVFDGALSDAERKDIVNRYNNGEIKHLLISGAGGEGLDLKGTRLIQVMEPHWNMAKIHQVRARGIRYKSHHHLPEDQRTAHVQYLFSKKPQHPLHKMLGMNVDPSADEALHNIAKKKEDLNKRFMDALLTTNASIKKTASIVGTTYGLAQVAARGAAGAADAFDTGGRRFGTAGRARAGLGTAKPGFLDQIKRNVTDRMSRITHRRNVAAIYKGIHDEVNHKAPPLSRAAGLAVDVDAIRPQYMIGRGLGKQFIPGSPKLPSYIDKLPKAITQRVPHARAAQVATRLARRKAHQGTLLEKATQRTTDRTVPFAQRRPILEARRKQHARFQTASSVISAVDPVSTIQRNAFAQKIPIVGWRNPINTLMDRGAQHVAHVRSNPTFRDGAGRSSARNFAYDRLIRPVATAVHPRAHDLWKATDEVRRNVRSGNVQHNQVKDILSTYATTELPKSPKPRIRTSFMASIERRRR